MVRIGASLIGRGVPQHDFIGVVSAIHRRSCLITLTDDRLVTLVTREVGGLPYGITVDTPDGFTFDRSLVIGACAAVRGRMLRIDEGFCIDLRAARPWRSHLEAMVFDLARVPVRRAWHATWSAVCGSTALLPLLHHGGPAIMRMCEAACNVDSVAARQAMSGLIGLGEGSTPAGDDYLVGHFAGLCAGADGTRRRFVADLGESLRAMACRTNRISHMYLEAATEGEVSERLATLASRIAAGAGKEPVAAATAAALAVGQSSGACGVLGLLLGSAASKAADWPVLSEVINREVWPSTE